MNKRRLGQSDLYVSELGLGCMSFGEQRRQGFFDVIQTSQQNAERIISAALELGINFFDTADVYGEGASETLLGKALGARRKEVIVASKVGMAMGPDPSRRGLSRRHIIASCEASLRRLGTDYLDLYQAHTPDPATPVDETVLAFDQLVRQGKVRYLGASNAGAYWTTKSLWLAEKHEAARFVSTQLQYNLVTRDIEDELLPMCAAEGIGVLAWSPLASGFLSGKYARGEAPKEGTRLAAWKHVLLRHDTDRKWNAVELLQRVATEAGASTSTAALAWVLSRQVSSVLIGATTPEQLSENVKACSLRLPAAALKALDAATSPPERYPFGGMRKPE